MCALAELDEKETLIQLVMNLSSFYRSSLSNGKMHYFHRTGTGNFQSISGNPARFAISINSISPSPVRKR
ncbi:hypothetical protein MYD03_17720 [Mediterraneibacter gnavus]